jgi:hypothetical protein
VSFSYYGFQTELAVMMALPNAASTTPPITEPNFAAAIFSIVDYAEQRCYRELDLLNATSSGTMTLVAGQSTLNFSALNPVIIIVEDVNLILPSTATVPDNGERVQLWPVSRSWIRATYGPNSVTGPPQFFGMKDDQTFVWGPFPDLAYTVEVVGKFRPVPLYNAPPNDGSQTTWLSLNVPDLFLAAAMVSAAGFMKNFGAQSDDPRMAVSWEAQFQTLLGSAKTEEARKKFHGWGQLTSRTTPPPTPPGTPGGPP